MIYVNQDNRQELLPLVDTDGRVIGSATRGECHSGSMLLHPVVHLHVFNSHGELYLQKRPSWKDIQPGKWDTAVGGHIDYGEDTATALMREASEELGLDATGYEHLQTYVFRSSRESELIHAHRLVTDAPVRPSKETDGGRFWTMDEIRRSIGKGVFTPNFEQEFKRLFDRQEKKQLDIVFLIAGSEPLGSAGMQADIKAITACGGYAAGALTAIVDEDTRHVKSIHHLPVELIVSQTESFLGDVGAQCVKTGVLPSRDIIEGVAGKLAQYPEVIKVIDPVIVDSNGVKLVGDDAIQAYKDLLFPQATLITPNRREAEALLGHPLGNIEDDLRTLSGGTCSAIIKSVESEGENGSLLTDYLYDLSTDTVTAYTKERIPTHNVNGTGDSFASSIATYLAKGYTLRDAVARGEEFIQRAIALGAEYNFGSGYGPVHPCFMEDRSKHERIYG